MAREDGGETETRDLWWWVAAIVAPIGLLGGPIALADLAAGVIEWRGPIGYLVTFWSEHVAASFHAIYALIARLLRIGSFPDWLENYATIGFLLAGGIFRAASLTQRRKAHFDWWIPLVGTTIIVVVCVIFWPLLALLSFYGVIEPAGTKSADAIAYRRKTRQYNALAVAPFLIFLALYGINQLLG